MIRDIIVNLEHQIARDPARDFAITVAETFDTHVAGVAFVYIPEFPGYVMLEKIPRDMMAQMVAEGEKADRAAIERFDAAARRSLVSAEHRLLKALGVIPPEILSRLARRFDLSVLMQFEPGGENNDDMIETSLFQSGRAAARAFNDALPLLVKATKVELLIVLNEKTTGDRREIRGVEMAKHLARHDVNVQIETVPAADIDVTNAILSYVAENS
jgi:hypothetical protein